MLRLDIVDILTNTKKLKFINPSQVKLNYCTFYYECGCNVVRVDLQLFHVLFVFATEHLRFVRAVSRFRLAHKQPVSINDRQSVVFTTFDILMRILSNIYMLSKKLSTLG